MLVILSFVRENHYFRFSNIDLHPHPSTKNCSKESKYCCKPRENLAIKIKSSPYKRSLITNLPKWILSPRCEFSQSSSLLIYKPKKVGDNEQPCLTLILLLKLSKTSAEVLILTFTSSYNLCTSALKSLGPRVPPFYAKAYP